MCNNKAKNKAFQQEQENIIKRLEQAGIKVSVGKKRPRNGLYSGIIGNKRKVLNVNIPDW
jgi:hypothetical protein